jgi:AraC-like DNA-binding protein
MTAKAKANSSIARLCSQPPRAGTRVVVCGARIVPPGCLDRRRPGFPAHRPPRYRPEQRGDSPAAYGSAVGCSRLLFAGEGYRLGEFSCPAGQDRWRTTNWIGPEPHVVFPRTAVRIIADGGEPHVCTANDVLVYAADTHYRRELVSVEGDRCLYVTVSPPLADELALPSRPRPTPLRRAPCPARRYALAQRIRAVARSAEVDELRLDEAMLALLGATAATPWTASAVRRRAHRAAVEEVQRLVAGAPAQPWTLAELAARVHYSPYFLARLFRLLTGYSIAGYRQQLRLRLSLEQTLNPAADLSAIAAGYGFSSHSHYTRAFRQAFGCTPSQARAGYVLST